MFVNVNGLFCRLSVLGIIILGIIIFNILYKILGLIFLFNWVICICDL